MRLLVFGSNNPTGSSFLAISRNSLVSVLGRSAPRDWDGEFIYCDLSELDLPKIENFEGVLVSFAPIWLFASFIEHLFHDYPDYMKDIRGIIACSSSSFITKRFAFNEYDKQLAQKLSTAHEKIAYVCKNLNIDLQILAPTLVYGKVKFYSDKNLSKIIKLMRAFPFIFLPQNTGFRQPIHANQLALVAYTQAKKMVNRQWSPNEPLILPLGGDSIIDYKEMIVRVINSLDQKDKASRCRIICVPNQLYFLIAFPFLFFSPKFFEALMRIKCNLSHFTKAHEILNQESQEFPLLPLANEDE